MSVSKWAYTPEKCDNNPCPGDCDFCSKAIDEEWETNLYDVVEEHPNCTVQILRNSVTGEESVGWWENDGGINGDLT